MPSDSNEQLKTVMIQCHKCGWSYSSRKSECPMCGAKIVIKEKELVKYLAEYIDRQGTYASKKQCESFIKKFKKQKKRLPTLNELWKASLDYVKAATTDEEKLKKESKAKKKDLDIKKMQEKLKKKKIEELKKQKGVEKVQEVASKPASTIRSEEERLAELKRRREMIKASLKKEAAASASSEPSSLLSSDTSTSSAVASDPLDSKNKASYLICPTCGTKNPPGSKFCLEDGTRLS